MMNKLLSFSAMSAVVLAGMLATSCAPPAPARTSTYRPTTSYVKKPVVNIRNNSYRNLVVGVRGPETRMISVPARSSRTVYLRSGVYKYAAAARNTRTITGYKSFSANRRYTWNFGVN